jgi:hypothetical protein
MLCEASHRRDSINGSVAGGTLAFFLSMAQTAHVQRSLKGHDGRFGGADGDSPAAAASRVRASPQSSTVDETTLSSGRLSGVDAVPGFGPSGRSSEGMGLGGSLRRRGRERSVGEERGGERKWIGGVRLCGQLTS